MRFQLDQILRRTASAGNEFLAGTPFSDPWEKRAQLLAASFVVAWVPDATTKGSWWADVAWAASRQTPIIFATPRRDYVDLLQDVHGAWIYECESIDEATTLGRVFWTHDRGMVSSKQFGGFALSLLHRLEKVESPIEARLLLHLNDIEGTTSCIVHPQKEVGSYRVDIAVESLPEEELIQIAIECDGHEFHERTREQAARDKKRDRDLAAAGWTVLRFTGSEIWNDPRACVKQVLAVIERQGGLT